MKTALVILEFPYGPDRDDDQKTFHALSDAADKRAKSTRGIERLSQTVWLIDVASGLAFLTWLLASSEHHKIPSRTALLEETPAWIPIRPTT